MARPGRSGWVYLCFCVSVCQNVFELTGTLTAGQGRRAQRVPQRPRADAGWPPSRALLTVEGPFGDVQTRGVSSRKG